MARLRARRERAQEAPRTQKPQGRKKERKREENEVQPGVLVPPGAKDAGSDPIVLILPAFGFLKELAPVRVVTVKLTAPVPGNEQTLEPAREIILFA